MFNEKDELIIHIGGKEVKVKELIDTLSDIVKICDGNCGYCERKGIKRDSEKLQLIRELIKKRVGL